MIWWIVLISKFERFGNSYATFLNSFNDNTDPVLMKLDNVVHEGKLIKFIYTHFEFDENAEIVPLVDNEKFMRTHNLLDTSFIECRREDYV